MAKKKPVRPVLEPCLGNGDSRHFVMSCHPHKHKWKPFFEKGCIDNRTYYHYTEKNCGLICNIPAGSKFPESCLSGLCINDRMSADCKGCRKQ